MLLLCCLVSWPCHVAPVAAQSLRPDSECESNSSRPMVRAAALAALATPRADGARRAQTLKRILTGQSSGLSGRSSMGGEHRFVHFNTEVVAEHRFCSNKINTALCAARRARLVPRISHLAAAPRSYQWWNFVPKLIWVEFSKLANVYFLVRPTAGGRGGVPAAKGAEKRLRKGKILLGRGAPTG